MVCLVRVGGVAMTDIVDASGRKLIMVDMLVERRVEMSGQDELLQKKMSIFYSVAAEAGAWLIKWRSVW